MSCGCETAWCSICNKCRNHCIGKHGRIAQIERLREAGRKRNLRYRFDKASGHIFDGDHAVAYSHVTEWGEELVDVLNSAPQGVTK